MSRPLVRFTTAGFAAIIATIILFMFMEYLLGDFDQRALRTAENLFYIERVKLVDEETDQLDADDLVTTPIPERVNLDTVLQILEETDAAEAMEMAPAGTETPGDNTSPPVDAAE